MKQTLFLLAFVAATCVNAMADNDQQQANGFVGDNKSSLEKSDDVASIMWQGDWTMPTNDDFEELKEYCSWEWTNDYKEDGSNCAGYIIKSTNTGYVGVQIFLPAAGCMEGNDMNYEGKSGYYWTSTIDKFDSSKGMYLSITPDNLPTFSNPRFNGQSVRAVCPEKGNTNGHEAVDLGLPSGNLWASCNVGASLPEEPGEHYAWGEAMEKASYTWSTYKYMKIGKAEWKYINKYQVKDNQTEGMWYEEKK